MTGKKAAAPKTRGRAKSVDAYLARLPDEKRAALERLRKQILAAAPKATQTISYGIPTFVHAGNLVHMAAFKAHCSFFPGSGGVTMALASDLEGYKMAKGTIQFTPGKPIPAALVKRIVRMRVAENEARAAPKRKPGEKAPAKKVAAKTRAANATRKRAQAR